MKIRDLDLLPLGDKYLVIGCDSCAAIGQKKQDVVNAPFEIVGAMTLRVALMEVIVSGAEIIGVVDTLNTSLVDGGQKLIDGMVTELKRADINLPIFTGSTEDNFQTLQTGLGITVIGLVDQDKLRLSTAKKEDVIVVIGRPKVGSEVLDDNGEIIDINDVKTLLDIQGISEIIPVGSRGILGEVRRLCEGTELKYSIKESTVVDLKRSAGPSTCCIAACSEQSIQDLYDRVKKPIEIIGKIT